MELPGTSHTDPEIGAVSTSVYAASNEPAPPTPSNLWYDCRGGTADTKGVDYEQRLATLLYQRGLASTATFKLGFNVVAAGAFDDVVFRYRLPTTPHQEIITLIQAKHKSNSGEEVTHMSLATSPRKAFSIVKLFKSFLEVSTNKDFCHDKSKTYFVLYTNATVDPQKFSCSPEITDLHILLNTGGEKGIITLISQKDFDIISAKFDKESQELFQKHPREVSKFLERFVLCGSQANVDELHILIRKEIILNCKRMIPKLSQVCRKLIEVMKKIFERKNPEHKRCYLTECSDIWGEIVNSYKLQNTMLPKVKFTEDDVESLRQQIFDLTHRIVCMTFPGPDIQLGSLKLLQALSCTASQHFLMEAAADLEGKASTATDMWERGWCPLMVMIVGDREEECDTCQQLCQMAYEHPHLRLVLATTNSILTESLKETFHSDFIHITNTNTFLNLDMQSQNIIYETKINFQGRVQHQTLRALDQNNAVHKVVEGTILSRFLNVTTEHTIADPQTVVDDNVYIKRNLEKVVNIKQQVFRREFFKKVTDIFFVRSRTMKELPSCIYEAQNLVNPNSYKYDSHSDDVSVSKENSDEEALSIVDSNSSESDSHSNDIDSDDESEYYTNDEEDSKETNTHRTVTYYGSDNCDDIFELLCKRNEGKSIHWLDYERDSFMWKKSCGRTEYLCKFIEANGNNIDDVCNFVSKHNSNITGTEDLLQEKVRTVIIVGEPGMGKSKLLAHIVQSAREIFPASWVIQIALNKITKDLKKMELSEITTEVVCKILSEAARTNNSTCPELAEALLTDSILHTGNMIVLLDAFDEIAPDYCNQVLKILTLLKQSKISKLWVTTRSVMQEKLESRLESGSYVLQPISAQEQKYLLANWWSKNCQRDDLSQLAQQLLDIVSKSPLLKHGKSISCIPLNTLMLAETFEEHIADGNFTTVTQGLSLCELYRVLIDKKFDVYSKEKKKSDESIPAVKKDLETLRSIFMKNHMLCSLDIILNAKELEALQIQNMIEVQEFLHDIELGYEKTGIIIGVYDGHACFIHYTFVEYFAANWLVENRSKYTPHAYKILFKPWHASLRRMFDHILAKNTPLHQAVLNNALDANNLHIWQHYLNAVDDGGRTPLHLAAQHADCSMVQLLLDQNAHMETQDSVHQCTPVYYAAKSKIWEAVMLLVNHGAEVMHNIADKDVVREVLNTDEHFCNNIYVPCKKFEICWEVIVVKNNRTTIFHKVAGGGYLRCVHFLLQEGADASYQDHYGDTPLHYASKGGHISVVQALIQELGHAGTQNNDGQTPLYCAAEEGHVEVLDLLLQHHADVNLPDDSKDSPLHSAARNGHAQMVRLLIERNAIADAKDENGTTPLHCAAEEGYTDVVNLLLNRNADVQDKYGVTPLHGAAENGYTEVVRLLINGGAQVDIKDGNGATPIQKAAEEGHTETVNLLIQRGAKVNIKDHSGATTLHCASGEGHTEIVLLLIQNGANVDIQDTNGDTPLHLAVEHGHDKVVDLLLNNAANVGNKNDNGDTPLHCAAQEGDDDIVDLLLAKGVNVGILDNDGATPLHSAAREGHEHTVKLLLDNGASVGHQDNTGATPLHYAVKAGHTEAASLLTEREADAHIQDNNGITPLQLAEQGGLREIVRILHKRGTSSGP